MALILQLDIRVGNSRAPKRGRHSPGVFRWHHTVTTTVQQQDWAAHTGGVVNRGTASIPFGGSRIRAHEAIELAGLESGRLQPMRLEIGDTERADGARESAGGDGGVQRRESTSARS